jgi:hypothetical protein
MMMMLPTGVECSAKIAMTALRAWRYTTGLLRDLDQARRIFLWLSALHIFRSRTLQTARNLDQASLGAINGKHPRIFHLQSELGIARLYSQLADNEL